MCMCIYIYIWNLRMTHYIASTHVDEAINFVLTCQQEMLAIFQTWVAGLNLYIASTCVDDLINFVLVSKQKASSIFQNGLRQR